MTVLLDENIPRKLKWRLVERQIEVLTVPERGWAGMTNGELLDRAEEEFDALLTMDQGMGYQQNVEKRALGIVTIENLFGFWFAGESEQQCGENGTSIEVRSRGYGPKSGPICSPLKPLAAQSKKSKQVLRLQTMSTRRFFPWSPNCKRYCAKLKEERS